MQPVAGYDVFDAGVAFELDLVGFLSTSNDDFLRLKLHSARLVALSLSPYVLSDATLQTPEGESHAFVVTCSIQHFRRRPGCLLQVPNCPEPCHDVTERCRVWWAGAAWSIRLTWPKRVSPPTYSFFLWPAAVSLNTADHHCPPLTTTAYSQNQRSDFRCRLRVICTTDHI